MKEEIAREWALKAKDEKRKLERQRTEDHRDRKQEQEQAEEALKEQARYRISKDHESKAQKIEKEH